MFNNLIRKFYVDNVTLNPGVGGGVIATDDVGGVHFQRIKINLGGDGVDGGLLSDTIPLPTSNPEILITGQATGTVNNNIMLALAGTGVYDTTHYRAIILQVNCGAGISAGTVVFEQSNDQSIWFRLTLQNLDPQFGYLKQDGFTPIASTNFAFGGKAAMRYVRARISVAITGGTIQAYTYFRQSDYTWIERSQSPTYRASAAAVLVAAVTVNVPWFVIYGGGAKVIKVQKIWLSGLTLTAVAYLNIGLAKYSTAPTGGTATAFTKVPVDATDAASGAGLVQGYTAIPTTGTRIGFIDSRRVMGQATTAAAAGIPDMIEFNFQSISEKEAGVLRGTAQGIGLEWITAPASAVSCLVSVEWTEEPL